MVLFGFQFYPVFNLGKFINFKLGTVPSETARDHLKRTNLHALVFKGRSNKDWRETSLDSCSPNCRLQDNNNFR